ncbi:MAG: MMPL family transporter [Alphaproteobacteria bacterium]|nr:MMPL family transporter [Alphaproteobacteria bacterium]
MARAKNQIDAFATVFTEWVIRLWWLIVIVSLAGAFYVGQGAQNLEYSSNYRTFFSEQNPELRNFEDFQARYVKSDNFLFVIVPNDGTDVFDPRTIKAMGEMTEAGWQVPYARRVDSLTNFQYTYAIGDELIVQDLIEEPANVDAETLASRREAALAEPLLNGQLVTADARAAGLNVVLNYPEKSLDEVPEAVFAARAIRDRIEAEYPHLDVYLSGTSMLNNAFSEAIQSDFMLLIPIMIGAIILATIIAIRSVSATFVTVLIVVLSAAIAMGWAGLVGIKLAGPSPSAVIVILTLAIADSIHILLTARKAMATGLDKRAAIIEAMRVNFLAVSITSLTTIVGFLSLNFSDSPPFRDFGNISAVGILAAWALSLTLLPALLSVIPFKAQARDDVAGGSSTMRRFADFVIAARHPLFIVVGVGALAFIAFIPTMQLSDQFLKYFDPRIEFRSDSDAASNYFGLYPMEYSLDTGEAGSVNDPDYLRKLDAFTEWLRAQPNVMHVYSISDIMKRLNKNLNGDDPAFYSLPEEYDLAAQYLLLFELSLPYGLDLNDRIDIEKSASRVTASLNGDASTKDIRKLIADSESWFDANAPEIDGPATGPQVMFTFIAQRNIQSMIQGTTIAILAIGVIMMFALRSFSIGLLSMAPNGLPILAAFGAWALLVGEVGFSVAAVASMSLGIVIDDTVHFLTKYMRARRVNGLSAPDSIRYAFETVGVAILVNTAILGVGFSLLTFSAFKINAELGLLTVLSIGFALVLDFLLLPPLLLLTAGREKAAPASALASEGAA